MRRPRGLTDRAAVVACSFVLLLSARSSQAQSKKELALLVAAYRAQISDLAFSYTIECTRENEDPYLPKMVTGSRLHEVKVKGDMVFLGQKWWDGKREEGRLPHEDIRVYDGKVTRQHTPKGESGLIMSRYDETFLGYNRILRHALRWYPEARTGAEVPAMADLLSILRHPHTEVVEAPVEIHGARTVMVVAGRGALRIYLDQDHGGIPRRIEYYRQSPEGDLVLSQTHDVLELCKSANLSFPCHVVAVIYMDTRNPKSEWVKPAIRRAYSVIPGSLKINSDLSDDAFVYQYPAGTRVLDDASGVTFKVGGDPAAIGRLLDSVLANEDAPRALPEADQNDQHSPQPRDGHRGANPPSGRLAHRWGPDRSRLLLVLLLVVGSVCLLAVAGLIIAKRESE